MTNGMEIAPVRPGIAYSAGGEVIDLTDEEAVYVLAHDPRIRKEWGKWLARSGQAKLPPEERSGRVILMRGDEVIALLEAPAPPDEKQGLAEELAEARTLAELGDARAALKLAERVRVRAFAAADVSGLEQVLDLARLVRGQTGKSQDEAGRLAFSAQQNLRFVGRKQALAEGREWVDPYQALSRAASPPWRVQPSERRGWTESRWAPWLLLGLAVVLVGATWTPLFLAIPDGCRYPGCPLLETSDETDSYGLAMYLLAGFGLSWLVPGALVGFAAALWAKRRRRRNLLPVSVAIVIAAALLIGQAIFADSVGIHF